MASPSVIRLIDTCRLHVPGSGDGILRLELFNAAKEFFRETCIWREELNVFVTATSYDYDLITASRGVIHTLMRLAKPNPPVGPNAVNKPANATGGDFNADFNSDFSGKNSLAPVATGYPTQPYNTAVHDAAPREGWLLASGADDAILRIKNLPNANEVWIAEVALTVSDPTDGDGIPFMPDWIVEKYQDTLLDGVLSRIMIHPAKPYSSAQGAMLHGKRFNMGKGQARNDARHGATFGVQRWSFPQQFRTSSQRSI